MEDLFDDGVLIIQGNTLLFLDNSEQIQIYYTDKERGKCTIKCMPDALSDILSEFSKTRKKGSLRICINNKELKNRFNVFHRVLYPVFILCVLNF